MAYRIEKDAFGEMEVPNERYYGIQTMRAIENFPITGIPIEPSLVLALAHVKKAAAMANMEVGLLARDVGEAIVKAADEVINGQFLDEFVVDAIQGGAGTSINMNMNEVLANRALEWLGRQKGEYDHCNPNNDVNMSQSTNDAVPTAIRIAAFQSTQRLLEVMQTLKQGFEAKAKQFDDVIKMGRTHLQDAVPIRLGQEFGAYARVLGRDIERIRQAAQQLLTVNMGATAVGTGLNASPKYITEVAKQLSEQLGVEVRTSEDLVDGTQNTDAYTSLSAVLKVCAINMSKICNDLRLMASGPRVGLYEIRLPARQAGSSIMPGKVNPVMAEVMNQIAFQVIGNDQTIGLASEAGQFELNVMGPVLAMNLLQSLRILQNGMDVFYRYAIIELEANIEQCQAYVDESFGIATALNPHLGYEKSTQIVKEALATGKGIKELVIAHGLLSEEEINTILDPIQMTTPGIAGEHLLEKDKS